VGIDVVRASIGAGRLIPFVYGIRSWYGLRVRFISSLPITKTLIKKTWKTDRTNLGTVTASRAFTNVYISGNFIQCYLKIARFSGNLFNLG